MNFNYVSLDLVLERLNTIKIPGTEWNISDVKEWAWEALTLIGASKEFIETSIEVEIVDGKGKVPNNIHTIDSVLEGTSGFNMDLIPGYEDFRELTYKLNAGYIFTDFDKGSVIFRCYIFPFDEDNKPLIPDNEYFIKAVYSYIRMKIGERAMWQTKIVFGQYQLLEREWNFYCPAAKNASKMLNEDGRHSFKKKMLKSFPSMYRNNGLGNNEVTVNTKPR